MALEPEKFVNLLHAYNIDFQINRFNGVIQFDGFVFKAAYFVSALSEADEAFLKANQDRFGVAYKSAAILTMMARMMWKYLHPKDVRCFTK